MPLLMEFERQTRAPLLVGLGRGEVGEMTTAPQRLFSVIAPGAGLIFSSSLVWWVYNSPRDGMLPECAFYRVTGFFCPGCGGMRSVHDLIHGDLIGALSSNMMIIFVIYALLSMASHLATSIFSIHLRRRLRNLDFLMTVAALIVMVVFGVVRNFKVMSFLQPV